LKISGPYGGSLSGAEDNLVLRAASELAARVDKLRFGAFALVKYLPVASGLGGGSADAAAALRALCQANRIATDDSRVIDAALATGSDVRVCLTPRARLMRGRGDILQDAPASVKLFAVLVNPSIEVSTAKVFARLGLAPGETLPRSMTDERAHIDAQILGSRNDLQAPAIAVTPEIGDVLASLATLPGVRLARMSGSGATCFALFDDAAAAAKAAAQLRRRKPDWWVRATRLS
jgi:4-diphosphocytidyl-2-C-methyl-D-erythritol kinase